MDSAKVNIAPSMTKAKWFRLIGVPLNNGTDLYPNGDTVQTVEPWSPPETWDGLDLGTINRILDAIDRGLVGENGEPTGERYYHAGSAKERAAWRVVQSYAPQKTEKQCREILRQWVNNGVLMVEIYYSKAERKSRSGLRVNAVKKPGTRIDI
jgi:hypothetical protein